MLCGSQVGSLRALKEVNPSLDFPDGVYGCSAGCLFALGAAFRIDLDRLEESYMRFFNVDAFLSLASIDGLQKMGETKGLLPTEYAVEPIIQAFLFLGIDLRTMVMDDAPQKLYFVSSNMTTRRPALLTGNVPIVKALACSICIPFVFQPVSLYDNIHLDGGVYSWCISTVVPEDTLAIHVSGTGEPLTENSSLAAVFAACFSGKREIYFRKNVLRIKPIGIGFLDEVTREQKAEMVKSGYLQTRAFLAKRLAEEHK